MHTLTLPEKLALKLPGAQWYEAVLLSEEDLLCRKRIEPIWRPPEYMKGVYLVATRADKSKVHLVRLGKIGSAIAKRRRRYLERLGCVESETEQMNTGPS